MPSVYVNRMAFEKEMCMSIYSPSTPKICSFVESENSNIEREGVQPLQPVQNHIASTSMDVKFAPHIYITGGTFSNFNFH